MTPTLARLHAEHANLERLVRLLDDHASVPKTPTFGDLGVVVDTVYYLTHFPDVSHHPLEDRIVEQLRGRQVLPAGFADEIEAQHVTLAHQGDALMRDLESAARGETLSWEIVSPNLRLYAERLRHNMAVEELILFPTARRVLENADWQVIDAALDTAQDPLFGARVDDRFRQLHAAIAAQAHCDCDLAPGQDAEQEQ